LLDFGGDFQEAARDLAKRGFGDKGGVLVFWGFATS
jgi:hypothetical protein